MLKDAKSRRNLVPVLMHTLDILELLLKSDAPLKMYEISETTGISLTTTYRILQTLLYRGYLAQDRTGRLTMLDRLELKSVPVQETSVTDRLVEPEQSGEQAIEILHRVPRTLRERERSSFDAEIPGQHSLQRQRI